MGFFTLSVACALVVLQCTTIVLQRDPSAWSFSFVSAAPDASEWSAQLPWAAASSAQSNNSSSSSSSSSSSNVLLVQVRENDALLCLRLFVSNRSSSSGQQSTAASCLLRAHSPAAVTAVLAPWNPHILLLALCALQTLYALGRVLRRGPARIGSVDPRTTLLGAGAVLTALLAAALAVQGVHDADLARYPTLIAVGVLWLAGLRFALTESPGLPPPSSVPSAAVATVAAPLAVLVTALLGPRLWSDALAQGCVLAAACCALSASGAAEEGAFIGRQKGAAALLVLVFAGAAAACTGPFDSWRYIVILVACVGLLPLLPVVGDTRRSSSGGIALMANNAALIGTVVTLASF